MQIDYEDPRRSSAPAGEGGQNIAAEKPKADANDLAGMVLTFFTGLSLEQNLKSSRTNTGRKVDNLMRVLRRL
jgi:hypothetical protein